MLVRCGCYQVPYFENIFLLFGIWIDYVALNCWVPKLCLTRIGVTNVESVGESCSWFISYGGCSLR